MARPIEDMPNLGPYISRRLMEIGVRNEVDLRKLGAPLAFHRLRFRFGREITLSALWAMDGALLGVDWRRIPQDRKMELRRQLSDLSQS